MLRAIREEVDALYIEGTRYRKTGIVFFGLEKPGTAHQTDLFDDTPPAEKSRLYADVDALNARYGNDKVFSARHFVRRLRRRHGIHARYLQLDYADRRECHNGQGDRPDRANHRNCRFPVVHDALHFCCLQP